MIATGTDIKPLEIVMFMRAVKSRTFFEQMKGRGVRVIAPTTCKASRPTPRPRTTSSSSTAVGVCEQDMTDSRPMDRKKSVSFEKLLQAVALGQHRARRALVRRRPPRPPGASPARRRQEPGSRKPPAASTLKDLARGLVDALDPDQSPGAGRRRGTGAQAVKPLCDPKLRHLILDAQEAERTGHRQRHAGPGARSRLLQADRDRAEAGRTFEQFIADHKDEITALQILYNRPTKAPLTFEALKELADALQAPPHLSSESALWQAYAALDKPRQESKARARRRILTDLVSLVRFAMHQDNELVPFPERVNANFKAWLAPAAGGGQGRSPTSSAGGWR